MVKVAIYCRLSSEDVDKSSNIASESIQNQKSMLKEYAKDKGWEIYRIYCDEDYSGADQNVPRPEFSKLLKDAESKNFNIVLCKTQSRFSRDIEVVERYINNKFLEWGIRFVSVVDNADTEVKSNKKARQINGLVNEWFLEELSENIKTTLRHKKQNGQFTGSFAPYGYKKSLTNKNQIVIDEPAAAIVREIFRMYDSGMSYNKIAHALNQRMVPNPLTYKRQNGCKISIPSQSSMCNLWTRNTLRVMLRNPVYIGTLVQCKSETISYKNSKKRQVPKDRQVIVSHTHEAIIENDVWSRLQKRFQTRCRPQYNGEIHVFSQKVFCACCNNSFHKNISNGYHYLRCKTISMDRSYCANNKNMAMHELMEIILNKINLLIVSNADEGEVAKQINFDLELQNKTMEYKIELANLERNSARLSRNLKSLYEDKLAGFISVDEFVSIKEPFQEEAKNINSRRQKCEQELAKLQTKQFSAQEKIDFISQFKYINALSHEIMDAFIEKILIGEKKETGREIQIYWAI